MKKLMTTALALCLAGALTACAGGATSEAASSSEATSSSEVASSEAASSEASSAAETTETTEATVLSYDEYMAADLDTEVTIQAYVQAKQSYYAEQGTATVYLQDQDGGYFAYDMACTQEEYDAMTEGTQVQITGFKSEWSGEVEIMDGKLDAILDGDTFVSEPLDVTELLGTDELESHQNEKVKFTGLTVAPSTDADGNEVAFLYNYDGSGEEGSDLYFNVSYNGGTYSFVIESYLCDASSEVYSAVKNLEVGQTIDCEGFLYWYEGANPHITSVTVTG